MSYVLLLRAIAQTVETDGIGSNPDSTVYCQFAYTESLNFSMLLFVRKK